MRREEDRDAVAVGEAVGRVSNEPTSKAWLSSANVVTDERSTHVPSGLPMVTDTRRGADFAGGRSNSNCPRRDAPGAVRTIRFSMSLPVIVSVTFANSIGRAGAGAWLSGDLLALSR